MKEVSILVLVAALLTAAGCDKKTDTQSIPPGAAAGPTDGDVHAALSSYETIRAMLAKDETKELSQACDKLAASASAAATKTTGESQPYLQAIAGSAKALKNKASDIEAARVAFGELSRHVIALLKADSKLREGRYLFECPMAQGYKKWVQTKDAIDNPYMGKKMLECGGKSAWES